MMPTPEVQARLRQYLLGQLAEELREETETGLLKDEELFEELLIAEDELSDDYLSGKLSDEEKQSFEQHFLATPERIEKLRFAQAFKRRLAAAPPQEITTGKFWPALKSRQFLGVGVAVTALVLIAVVAGLWIVRNQRTSPRTFATLNLTIIQGTRGDGTPAPAVRLPLREDALKLVLSLPEKSPPALRYRAELETGAGEKRRLEPASHDGQSVTVVILRTELSRGLYLIRLFAVGNAGVEQRLPGGYFFTVD
jgi:hypothetical protein